MIRVHATKASINGYKVRLFCAIVELPYELVELDMYAGEHKREPYLTLNPFVPVETMTAYIVQVSLGDTPTGTLEFKTIFAVGMTLFLLTLGLNILSQRLVRRFRERYE